MTLFNKFKKMKFATVGIFSFLFLANKLHHSTYRFKLIPWHQNNMQL